MHVSIENRHVDMESGRRGGVNWEVAIHTYTLSRVSR